MRLKAEVNGEERELEIKADGQNVMAVVDGRRYEVEARNTAPGVYLFVAGGRVYECLVSRRGEGQASLEVSVGGRAYSVALTDPKRLRGTQSAAGHADGTARIVAAMPGKVVRVLVEAGAEVEAGAGIVVLEAMKMQNEMKAPKPGRVTVLNVAEGATVNAGDLLAVIE